MMKRSGVISLLKPTLALYIPRLAFSALIAFPVFVYLDSYFSNSAISELLWPIPSDYALIELSWNLNELLLFAIPLLLLVIFIGFITNQFIYGGVYGLVYAETNLSLRDFFASCGGHFGGFVKIAIAGGAGFILVFLAADLIGMFIGKVIGLIYRPLGTIITIAVVFILVYIYLAFLSVMRLTQVQHEISSLRKTYSLSKEILTGTSRYFMAVNIMAGFFAMITIAIILLPLFLVYRLPFSQVFTILIVLFQQIAVFWICFLEVIQVTINRRFVKES